ncbi:MAG: ABC transporter ATP-binding protein [Cyclobacteriaceae bacterium]
MIEITNLSFNYGSKPPLFDHLNLKLPAGNIYGLLGKNGAGKSTLLKLMSGLLFPGNGDVQIEGSNPCDRQPQLLQEIYLVSEEFDLPSMKMEHYIKYMSPFYPRFSSDAMNEYLREFGLDPTQKLTNLSYGQKKKFLLSFGLATDCKVLILDEPSNGLDIPSKSQFRKVVANAIYEERTFIISTHQARDMENLIDPIIILDEGVIIFNQHYEDISNKLAIERQTNTPGDEAIYIESTLGSYTVVKENKDQIETNMNLELLFNAVVSNKEQIYEIFNETES